MDGTRQVPLLRFGVLGVSHFAVRRMIPAMRRARDVQVVAIASRDGERARAAAASLGVGRAYGSYEELIADPTIDAVYNPLPNHLHVEWSERAARAGKHVLVEKPVALTAADARRLLAVRDQTGRLICEAAMVRVHPRWLAIRELVRQGKIGALRAFTGTFAYDMAARDPARTNIRYSRTAGGGVTLDTGFYPVTMSRFCFDDEPAEVVAMVEPDPDTGVDRLASALLRYPSGHATLTCGMELGPGQRAALHGTAGHIDVPTPWSPPPERPSEVILETSPQLEHPLAQRISFDPTDQYALLAELFARAAAEPGNPGPVRLEDSVKNAAVLEALLRSATSRRWEKPLP